MSARLVQNFETDIDAMLTSFRSSMVPLDTQLILWAAFAPERLSVKAAKQSRSRETPLAFSLASLWEVAIKAPMGRTDFAVDGRAFHQALLNKGFVELPVQTAHISHVAALSSVHRDAFDRLLVAQRMVKDVSLLTPSATFKGYGRFVKVA